MTVDSPWLFYPQEKLGGFLKYAGKMIFYQFPLKSGGDAQKKSEAFQTLFLFLQSQGDLTRDMQTLMVIDFLDIPFKIHAPCPGKYSVDQLLEYITALIFTRSQEYTNYLLGSED